MVIFLKVTYGMYKIQISLDLQEEITDCDSSSWIEFLFSQLYKIKEMHEFFGRQTGLHKLFVHCREYLGSLFQRWHKQVEKLIYKLLTKYSFQTNRGKIFYISSVSSLVLFDCIISFWCFLVCLIFFSKWTN